MQDKETQLDVLGRTRFELFKNGEDIGQFVDNGKILTIKQLSESLMDDKEIIKNKDLLKYKYLDGLTEEEKKLFENDIKNISTEQKTLLEKYTENMEVDFHSPSAYQQGNKIFLNINEVNEKSKCLGFVKNITTYLHESGHWLDFYMLGNNETIHSRLPDLRKKLKEDFLNYCNNNLGMKKKAKYLKDLYNNDAGLKIYYNLKENGDMKNGVNDIISGLTKNKISTIYLHHTSYWKDNTLEKETVAHFFEARGSGKKKVKILKEYFPTAYQYFEDLLKEIVK